MKFASSRGGEDVDVGLLGCNGEMLVWYLPTSPHVVTAQMTDSDNFDGFDI
jgi:hypothetical protein